MESESENDVRVRVPCRAHQMATAENESTHLCLSLLCPRVTERANKRPEAMDDLILSVGVFRTRPTDRPRLSASAPSIERRFTTVTYRISLDKEE